MENSTEKYYIVGLRPVKLVKDEKGQSVAAYAFDWATGEFELALQYLDDIFFRHGDDARLVSKEQFDEKVRELLAELQRQKRKL